MKQIYSLIYAAYETFNNKRQFLVKLISDFHPELMDEFISISVLERAFVKEYKLHTLIKDVRHRVGGHIHNDYCLWYETVVNLEPQHTAEMTIAFMKAFSPIQHLTMKLAGFEHEKFLKLSNDSAKNVNDLLDKIENLTCEANAKQPDGMKLYLDMKVFRDMLK